MNCHISKKATAAQILPKIPEGKELRKIDDEVRAFILQNQPTRTQKKGLESYVEIRDMEINDAEQFGDSVFNLRDKS